MVYYLFLIKRGVRTNKLVIILVSKMIFPEKNMLKLEELISKIHISSHILNS